MSASALDLLRDGYPPVPLYLYEQGGATSTIPPVLWGDEEMTWLHIGCYESCVPLACTHTAVLRLSAEDQWRGRVREQHGE